MIDLHKTLTNSNKPLPAEPPATPLATSQAASEEQSNSLSTGEKRSIERPWSRCQANSSAQLDQEIATNINKEDPALRDYAKMLNESMHTGEDWLYLDNLDEMAGPIQGLAYFGWRRESGKRVWLGSREWVTRAWREAINKGLVATIKQLHQIDSWKLEIEQQLDSIPDTL
ncbi:MAG: hypothetical protein AB1489_07025 [Acidobacteriota bacterium]